MKILKRVLVGLLGLVLLVCATVFVYLQTTKPKLSGEIALNGITNETEVIFDSYGVPHIYAQNARDAYFALGYVHAQDRLFQMEMLRRAASGRLAEVLGPELLDVDKLFRTLGLNRFARTHNEKYLSADTAAWQQAVHAYLDGVNAYIGEGTTPVEFVLTGIPLTPFTGDDVYSVVGFMALGFAEGFEVDPVLEKIRIERGSAYLEDLAVQVPADAEIIPVHPGPVRPSMNGIISAINGAVDKIPVPLLRGSNGWVVSGKRSQSGYPILANDTHIGFSQPAVWYEAHIEYPGFRFYGHHLAGLPFGILGNNMFCGWGVTMFENDDVDFFHETINPENSAQVWFRDHWEELAVRKEVIKVKDNPDFELEVKESRHGPIINGVVKPVNIDQPVAVSWLLLHHDNRALEAAYRLGQASTFEEAEYAVSLFSAPGLNVMYGDVSGNIAWWAAARLPVRRPHVNSKLFLDGASGHDEYDGFYDFSYNPKSVNPPWGFVYSANNQPDSIKGVSHAGYYFPRSRAGRIVGLLKGDLKLSLDDMKKISLDDVSHLHADIAHTLALIARDVEHAEDVSVLTGLLREWNGEHGADRAEPAVYYNVLSHLLTLTLRDELGDEAYGILMNTALFKNSILPLIGNSSSPWWDDVTTDEKKETRDDIVAKAFEAALHSLRETMGKDPDKWKWSAIHTLTHKHPLGNVEPLDKLFDVGPFGVGGGSEVINNLDFTYQTSGYFPARHGPALRKIMDFHDVTAGVTVSPTGQSGNVMSPHYKDQAQMFVDGMFRPMLMDRATITASSPNRLILRPQ